MITIKDLSWSNWFSYGGDNKIDFSESVLQVTGKNGVGKTSIPIILQELYYGKNCKGKKKTSLSNRHLKDAPLIAESNFVDEEGNKYNISLVRKSTLKLILTKNGEDISSHTATNTYKSIENILGLDFKTFSQITYQSSTDGLDFLISTDSNRKKFLTGLFGLDKYNSLYDSFKSSSAVLSTDIASISTKIDTIRKWMDRYKEKDLIAIELQDVPDIVEEDISKASDITNDIKNIVSTNKRINTNNTFIDLLSNLNTDFDSSIYVDTNRKKEVHISVARYKTNRIEKETKLKIEVDKRDKITKLGDKCMSCYQSISVEDKESMLYGIKNQEELLKSDLQELNSLIESLDSEISVIRETEIKINKNQRVEEEFTRLTTSIDQDLATEVLDKKDLEVKLSILNKNISKIKEEINSINSINLKSSAHNERIKVIIEQLAEHREDIVKATNSYDILKKTAYALDILKKAFSPSGLISYKIDYLVKDLENEINHYLGEFSGGKFQLQFKLESEKLNVEIIDNGNSISIQEVSAGELARINASTLLAIRKLMSAISTTKVNVLFLDEILAVLDDEGRDSLIEVLHKEQELNTIIVSHQWSHPLIPKINIIKENKVSKIEI